MVSVGSRLQLISIHALVKRATMWRISDTLCRIISIHALVKRATYLLYPEISLDTNFNPRPREEGDVPATRPAERGGNFNPRPREEGDS